MNFLHKALELIESFMSEIILSVAMFAVGFIVTFVKKMYSKHKDISILRFDNEKERLFACYTANSGHYDENELVTLGYVFEYMAVGELRSFFRTTYKNVSMSVKMSQEQYENNNKRDLYQDLILIGGPFHNSITRKLVMSDRSKVPFYFDEDASLVYEGPEGKKVFTPKLSEGDKKYYEDDYALILNIENPLKPGKRILAFMGCRSIGCYAASYYITHYLKNLKKLVSNKNYALVIKVTGDEEDIIDEPQLVWHCNLD